MCVIKKGFTLAEVLITLLIIGVIASIVIPGLIADTQNAELKMAWKKTFADFSQAVTRLKIDQGGSLAGLFTSHDTFRNAFLPYLNYTKLCNADSLLGSNGCWSAFGSYYQLSGQIHNDYTSYSRLALNNGILLTFFLINSNCVSNSSQWTDTPNHDSCGSISFDINGFKGPNKIGKDIFAAQITKSGSILPSGIQGDYQYNNPSIGNCDVKTYPNTEGWGCSTLYLSQ